MSKLKKFGGDVWVAGKPLPIGLELSPDISTEDGEETWDVSFRLGGAKGGWKSEFEARDYAVECLKALIEVVRVSPEERGAVSPPAVLWDLAVAQGLVKDSMTIPIHDDLIRIGWMERSGNLTATGKAVWEGQRKKR